MAIDNRHSRKDVPVLTASEDNRGLLSPADLTGEIEVLREELRKERDRNLRTLADFKNYRRHIERKETGLPREGSVRFSSRSSVSSMIWRKRSSGRGWRNGR